MNPWSRASSRTLTGRFGNRLLCSAAVAMTALPSVSAACGTVRTSSPLITSAHAISGMWSVGDRKCGASSFRSCRGVESERDDGAVAQQGEHGRQSLTPEEHERQDGADDRHHGTARHEVHAFKNERQTKPEHYPTDQRSRRQGCQPRHRPREAETKPETETKIAAGVTASGCAMAAVAIAFIGCTDIGVRK